MCDSFAESPGPLNAPGEAGSISLGHLSSS
jgi:hypothetical protein